MTTLQCICGRPVAAKGFGPNAATPCDRCGSRLQLLAGHPQAVEDFEDDLAFAARLIEVNADGRAVNQFVLCGRDPLVIGRHKRCHLHIDDPAISASHAQLLPLPTQWRIEDQDSTNGLFINGQRVVSHTLADGDVIKVGHVQLQHHAPTPAHAPTVRLTNQMRVRTSLKPLEPEAEQPSLDEMIAAAASEEDSPAAPATAASTPIASAADRPHRPPPGSIPCPACGRNYPPHSKICTSCGIKLRSGRPIAVSIGEPEYTVYQRALRIIWFMSWATMAGFLPFASEAYGARRPYVIWFIAAVTCAISLWFMAVQISGSPQMRQLKQLMLWGGDGLPHPLMLDLYYEQTTWGDRQAYQRKKQQLKDTVPDANLSLAAHEALSPDQQAVGRYRHFQLLTHMFLHGGLLHLLGNMLLLLVLGTRVNAAIGHGWAGVCYLLLDVAAAAANLVASADEQLMPMIGASGAIMGMAGMYLVYFPVQRVHIVFYLRLWPIGIVVLAKKFTTMRGIWLLMLMAGIDVFMLLLGVGGNVAHWAHLGGFAGGVVLAVLLLVTRAVRVQANLITVIFGKLAWPIVGRPARRVTQE